MPGKWSVAEGSVLAGQTLGKIEMDYDVSVVLLKRKKAVDLHPSPEIVSEAGDEITIFADTGTLQKLTRLSR